MDSDANPTQETEEHTPEQGSGEPAPDGRPDLKRVIEAVLFTQAEPVGIARIVRGLRDGTRAGEVRSAVRGLQEEYEREGRGFRIEEVAGGYRMVTAPEYYTWVEKFAQERKEAKLSQAAFETLAIVAYKQPITRADLEAIRGVQCGPVLKTLLDRGLVRIVGRAQTLGRPALFGTTRDFLECFGLPSLRNLPLPGSEGK